MNRASWQVVFCIIAIVPPIQSLACLMAVRAVSSDLYFAGFWPFSVSSHAKGWRSIDYTTNKPN